MPYGIISTLWVQRWPSILDQPWPRCIKLGGRFDPIVEAKPQKQFRIPKWGGLKRNSFRSGMQVLYSLQVPLLGRQQNRRKALSVYLHMRLTLTRVKEDIFMKGCFVAETVSRDSCQVISDFVADARDV